MTDGATLLLGLPGVRVERVERRADGTRLVHVVTADEAAAACPKCGVVSTSIKRRASACPRDISFGERFDLGAEAGIAGPQKHGQRLPSYRTRDGSSDPLQQLSGDVRGIVDTEGPHKYKFRVGNLLRNLLRGRRVIVAGLVAAQLIEHQEVRA